MLVPQDLAAVTPVFEIVRVHSKARSFDVIPHLTAKNEFQYYCACAKSERGNIWLVAGRWSLVSLDWARLNGSSRICKQAELEEAMRRVPEPSPFSGLAHRA